jgi:opacity protein-like surface antigen
MKINKIRTLTVLLALAVMALTRKAGADEPAGNGYFAFEAGTALQQDITIKDSGGAKASFDPGFRFDMALGVGSRRPNSWGAEFEAGLTYNSMKPNTDLGLEGLDFYEIPMMLNVIYTLPIHGPVTAYVGAGIGGVYGIFAGSGTSFLGFSTDLTFGYQGIAGVRYSFADKWDIGLAYKFLGTTDHDMGGFKSDGTMTHSFLATLTLKF